MSERKPKGWKAKKLSRAREVAILLDIEDATGEHAMGDGTPLSNFASAVYQAIHWITSPDCRRNHPDFEPKPSDAALRYARKITRSRRYMTAPRPEAAPSTDNPLIERMEVARIEGARNGNGEPPRMSPEDWATFENGLRRNALAGGMVLSSAGCRAIIAEYDFLRARAEDDTRDRERLDELHELVVAADFAYEVHPNDGAPVKMSVMVFEIRNGVRVNDDVRAWLDSSRAAMRPATERSDK